MPATVAAAGMRSEDCRDLVDRTQTERLTNIVLARSDAAELDSSPAARFRDRDARSNQIVDY